MLTFCSQCNNAYYIAVDNSNQNQLLYYCRHCGHQDNVTVQDGACILATQFQRGEQKFHHMINEYTHLDPTLPRIRTMQCPNAECPTITKPDEDTTAPDSEVIYLRYDDDNLKYLYICLHCKHVWKTDDMTR